MSTVTSAFIDLATFDDLDNYMYAGPNATAYFVRETRKSTWFSQVPVPLSSNGNAAFGTEWVVHIARSGDYLLNTWLRTVVSATAFTGLGADDDSTYRWCRNLAHNMIEYVRVDFNGMKAEQWDSVSLDFWAAFTVPAGKQDAYDLMIGNTNNAVGGVFSLAASNTGPGEVIMNLPIPFFFTRDTGVALPTAALPYNEMTINIKFRRYQDLLVQQTSGTGVYETLNALTTVPTISAAQVWGNYAIVSNDERKRMACAPRDMLIEQVQIAPTVNFDSSATNAVTQIDLRFSHSVKLLLFGAKFVGTSGTSGANDHSNYSDTVPTTLAAAVAGSPICTFPNAGIESAGGIMGDSNLMTLDPMVLVSLVYENTRRLNEMNAEYFSLTQPFYQPSATIPRDAGYHMYSYSLDFLNTDPMGSTNYGKLTNVSLRASVSDDAVTATASFQLYVMAVNNNVLRVSGGAMGFPVI